VNKVNIEFKKKVQTTINTSKIFIGTLYNATDKSDFDEGSIIDKSITSTFMYTTDKKSAIPNGSDILNRCLI
jgi:hypothetical protein